MKKCKQLGGTKLETLMIILIVVGVLGFMAYWAAMAMFGPRM